MVSTASERENEMSNDGYPVQMADETDDEFLARLESWTDRATFYDLR